MMYVSAGEDLQDLSGNLIHRITSSVIGDPVESTHAEYLEYPLSNDVFKPFKVYGK